VFIFLAGRNNSNLFPSVAVAWDPPDGAGINQIAGASLSRIGVLSQFNPLIFQLNPRTINMKLSAATFFLLPALASAFAPGSMQVCISWTVGDACLSCSCKLI